MACAVLLLVLLSGAVAGAQAPPPLALPPLPDGCETDARLIEMAETGHLADRGRYGPVEDLDFDAATQGRDEYGRFSGGYRVKLWLGGDAYVLAPTSAGGCDVAAGNAAHEFVAATTAWCQGAQRAVYDLQWSVLRGEDNPESFPAPRFARFFTRTARLAGAVKKKLAAHTPPPEFVAQWAEAVDAFGFHQKNALDNASAARSSDPDSVQPSQDYDAAYDRLATTWTELESALGAELRTCSHLGLFPSSGR
jgi:hypothetical protein